MALEPLIVSLSVPHIFPILQEIDPRELPANDGRTPIWGVVIDYSDPVGEIALAVEERLQALPQEITGVIVHYDNR